MADIKHGYMTVTVDYQPEGLNMTCWMSTVDFWTSEKIHYPYTYVYMGDICTWLIHSNSELTAKAVALVSETADTICKRQQDINDRRKLANR